MFYSDVMRLLSNHDVSRGQYKYCTVGSLAPQKYADLENFIAYDVLNENIDLIA